MNYDKINTFRGQLQGMSEKLFFFAYENYLHKIQTPYHKSILEDGVITFFLDEKNQDRVLMSFDRLDSAFCYFISKIEHCTCGLIHEYFDLLLTSQVVTEKLENLKMRLIIVEDVNKAFYTVNHLLFSRIASEKCSLSYLIGTGEIDTPRISQLYCDDHIIGSNYILGVASIYTKSAKTQKTLTRSLVSSRIFPLIPEPYRPVIFSNILNLLESITDNRMDRILNESKFKDLLDWTPLQLAIYQCSFMNEKLILSITELLELLGKTDRMSMKDFINLFRFLNILYSAENRHLIWIQISHLLIYNIVRIDENGKVFLNRNLGIQASNKRSKIIESSPYEFKFYSNPSSGDSALAYLAEIVNYDQMATYQISYEGFKCLYASSDNPEEVFSLFVDSPIALTLSRFKEEMNRFSISEGYLLESHDKSLTETMKTMKELQPFIIRTIGENIFLLSSRLQSQWVPIIRQFVNLDLKLSNLNYARSSSHSSFQFPKVGLEPLSLGEEKVFQSEQLKEMMLSLIVDRSAFKAELISDINNSLVIDQRQFNKYLTTEAKTAKGGDPDYRASLLKIKKMLSSKAKKMMVKTGGKTLIVQPICIDDEKADAKLVFQEFPSMKENSVYIKCIQAISSL